MITHPGVDSNLYEFLSDKNPEHKRHFEEFV